MSEFTDRIEAHINGTSGSSGTDTGTEYDYSTAVGRIEGHIEETKSYAERMAASAPQETQVENPLVSRANSVITSLADLQKNYNGYITKREDYLDGDRWLDSTTARDKGVREGFSIRQYQQELDGLDKTIESLASDGFDVSDLQEYSTALRDAMTSASSANVVASKYYAQGNSPFESQADMDAYKSTVAMTPEERTLKRSDVSREIAGNRVGMSIQDYAADSNTPMTPLDYQMKWLGLFTERDKGQAESAASRDENHEWKRIMSGQDFDSLQAKIANEKSKLDDMVKNWDPSRSTITQHNAEVREQERYIDKLQLELDNERFGQTSTHYNTDGTEISTNPGLIEAAEMYHVDPDEVDISDTEAVYNWILDHYKDSSTVSATDEADMYLTYANSSIYRLMTDEELANYSYWAGKSEEEGKAYLAWLEDEILEQRLMEDSLSKWSTFTAEEPWIANAISIFAIIPAASGSIRSLLSGEIDENDAAFIPAAIRSQVTRDTTKMIDDKIASDTWSWLATTAYQGFRSAIESRLLLETVGPGMTLAIMGSAAASDTMLELKQRGIDDDDAMAVGFLAGVFEALFEKVSLDRIVNWENDGSLARTLKLFLEQGIIEGSEEVATDIANIMAQALLLGDKSQYGEMKRELTLSGQYTAQQIDSKIAGSIAKQLFDSFAGGMFGGLFGGGLKGAVDIYNATSNEIQMNKYYDYVGNTVLESQNETASKNYDAKASGLGKYFGFAAQDGNTPDGYSVSTPQNTIAHLIDAAIALPNNSTAYSLGSKLLLEYQRNSDYKPTAREIGKLTVATAVENARIISEAQNAQSESAQSYTSDDESNIAADVSEQESNPVGSNISYVNGSTVTDQTDIPVQSQQNITTQEIQPETNDTATIAPVDTTTDSTTQPTIQHAEIQQRKTTMETEVAPEEKSNSEVSAETKDETTETEQKTPAKKKTKGQNVTAEERRESVRQYETERRDMAIPQVTTKELLGIDNGSDIAALSVIPDSIIANDSELAKLMAKAKDLGYLLTLFTGRASAGGASLLYHANDNGIYVRADDVKYSATRIFEAATIFADLVGYTDADMADVTAEMYGALRTTFKDEKITELQNAYSEKLGMDNDTALLYLVSDVYAGMDPFSLGVDNATKSFRLELDAADISNVDALDNGKREKTKKAAVTPEEKTEAATSEPLFRETTDDTVERMTNGQFKAARKYTIGLTREISDESFAKLTEADKIELEVIGMLGEQFGIQMILVDNIGWETDKLTGAKVTYANGCCLRANGKIIIAANGLQHAYTWIASHEIGHYIEINDRSAWKAIADYVERILSAKGMDTDERILSISRTQTNGNLTQARNEMVCNSLGAVFSNAESVESFVEAAPKAASIFRKAATYIVDKIRSLIEWLRGRNKMKELTILEGQQEELDTLANMLGKALTSIGIKNLNTMEDISAENESAIDSISEIIGEKHMTIDDISNLVEESKRESVALAAYDLVDCGVFGMDADTRIFAHDHATHIDNRSMQNMSNRSINAFSYDYPQLHSYFEGAARSMLSDLRATTKGQRSGFRTEDGEYINTSSKRATTRHLARLLDEEHMTYDSIESALNAIVSGTNLNNATVKRVEIVLDDMMTNGYEDISGRMQHADTGYIIAKNGIGKGKNVVSVTRTATQTQDTTNIDDRRSIDMGKRSISAYCLEYPQLREHFRSAAKQLRSDLKKTKKGGVRNIQSPDGSVETVKYERVTSEPIARLIDEMHMSYSGISKALDAIIGITDNGVNTAGVKRVEIVLNDILSNGYDSLNGRFNAVQDYIVEKKRIQGLHSRSNTNNQSNNYASNGDVRFSLSDTVEESRDLVAVHSLTGRDLYKALNLGALAGPSIAIMQKNMRHEGYGDCTLVFYKSAVDPQIDPRNTIYGYDAWTPTFPDIVDGIPDSTRKTFIDRMHSYMEKYDMSAFLNATWDMTAEDMNDEYEILLKTLQHEFEVIEKEGMPYEPNSSFESCESLYVQAVFLLEHGIIDIGDFIGQLAGKFTTEESKDIYSENRSARLEQNRKVMSVMQNYGFEWDRDSGLRDYDEHVTDIMEIVQEYKEGAPFFAKYAIRAIVELGRQQYLAWYKNLMNSIKTTKSLRYNGELHPVTIDNIIEAMKYKDPFEGVPIAGRINAIYNSTDEVRSKKSRLTSEYIDWWEIRDNLSDRIHQIENKLGASSELFLVINDTYGHNEADITKEIITQLENKGFAVTQDVAQDIADLIRYIMNVPTEFFEAKLMRGVLFNSVARAIIPRSYNNSLMQGLLDAGVGDVVKYEDWKNDERARLVAEIQDEVGDDQVYFSRTEDIAEMSDEELNDAYMQAYEVQDKKAERALVDEWASRKIKDFLPLVDDSGVITYKYHRGPAPKTTARFYKTFNIDEQGGPHATYAGVEDAYPYGVWLDAQPMEYYESPVNGRKYIYGTTGFNPKALGLPKPPAPYDRYLSYRPAMHGSAIPFPGQMRKTAAGAGDRTAAKGGPHYYMPHNKLIFEIEIATDIDYQEDAIAFAEELKNQAIRINEERRANGEEELNSSYRPQLEYVPYMGSYRYMNGGEEWVLSGTFRVVRVVPESEIRRVNAEAGRPNEGKDTLEWINGYSPEAFGLTDDAVTERYARGIHSKLMDIETYDDDGNIIPIERRFDASVQDARFSRTNDDIYFSLRSPIEETRNLIAVHNMTQEELLKTLQLGGSPMPSIAIIKAGMEHSKYGDVSLVFGKDTIDPQLLKANRVYGGDAWTPTYPQIEYKASESIEKRIYDKYRKLVDTLGYDSARALYSYANELEDRLNRDGGEAGMLARIYDDTDMMQLFLADSELGMVEPVIRETRTELPEADVKRSEFFINRLGKETIEAFKAQNGENPREHRRAYMEQHRAEIEAAYTEFINTLDFTDDQMKAVLDSVTTSDYFKFIRGAYLYLQDGRVTVKTEEDYSATRDAIREKAEAGGYREWVDDLFKGAEEKTGIRNNAETFTNSGNRRNWETLHWEVNLENVVRAMLLEPETGGNALFSGNSIFGVAAKQYGSVDEIRADSDRLRVIPDEEYKAISAAYGQRFTEIAQSIANPNADNLFIEMDNTFAILVDAVRTRKTKSGILNRIREYNKNATSATVDDLVALVSDISNMPTGYFEAKPRRAVMANEIKAAIIPDTANKELIDALKKTGVRYITYKAGDEQARVNALNGLFDVRFSRTNADLEYMSAVEADDKNTQRRIIKGAAIQSGYPLHLYHGTPNGTYTVFHDWQYFTPNRSYADVYQGQSASSLSYKKTADNRKTYDVYTRTEKPFDTRIPEIRDIYMREFYGKWGNMTPLTDRGLPDWTDGSDLAEFIEENDYDYDSIIVDEGGTGGYGDDVQDRGIAYMIRNPEQVKSADLVTYDDDSHIILPSQRFDTMRDDIRFSVNDVDRVDPMYSQMLRVAEEYTGKPMKAQSVINYLIKHGVKPIEIQWAGLEAWLEGKNIVQNDKLVDFIRGSVLEVETITKTGMTLYDAINEEKQRIVSMYEYDDEIDVEYRGEDIFKIEHREPYDGEEWFDDDAYYEDKPQKEMWISSCVFDYYKTEAFDTRDEAIAEAEAFRDWFITEDLSQSDNEEFIDTIDEETKKRSTLYDAYKINLHDKNARYIEMLFRTPTNQRAGYKAIHWRFEDDVFVHVRYQVANVDGEEILFVEEVQSDMANDFSLRAAGRESEIKGENVPEHIPFQKGNTAKSTYYEYAMKRLIRIAAEEGVDRLVWTNAELQVDRWSEEYRNFYVFLYDNAIPAFIRKYCKQWEVEISEPMKIDSYDVLSIPITEEMKRSVLEVGQPLYSRTNEDISAEEVYSDNEIAQNFADEYVSDEAPDVAEMTPEDMYKGKIEEAHDTYFDNSRRRRAERSIDSGTGIYSPTANAGSQEGDTDAFEKYREIARKKRIAREEEERKRKAEIRDRADRPTLNGMYAEEYKKDWERRYIEQEEIRSWIIPRSGFSGTPALEALGIRIEGSIGIYKNLDQLIARDKSAKMTRQMVKSIERSLKPSHEEKYIAQGIANATLSEDSIAPTCRRDVVIELADYYAAELAIGQDMIRRQRNYINAALDKQTEIDFGDADNYNPRPFGQLSKIVMNERTPERIMRSIFEGKGQRIYDRYFRCVNANEAERMRFVNAQLDRVRTFTDSKGKTRQLTPNERAAAQVLKELGYIEEILDGNDEADKILELVKRIQDDEVALEAAQELGLSIADADTANKYVDALQFRELLINADSDTVIINEAIEAYDLLYNQLYDAINDMLIAHGYEPIGFIRNYAPHMQDPGTQASFFKAIKTLGINVDEVHALPASIAGLTADFRPNKRFDPHFLKRIGDATKFFDIQRTFEVYMDYISDVFYHTDDIMRIRRVESFFRRKYSPENARMNIDTAEGLRLMGANEQAVFLYKKGMISDDQSKRSQQELNDMLDAYIEEQYNAISNSGRYSEFVTWLQNYANILAGKQSLADRSLEYTGGRNLLGLTNKLMGAFARTNVGANLSSVINQTSQLPLVAQHLGIRWTNAAIWDIMTGRARKASFAERSDFLYGKNGIDWITVETIDNIVAKLFAPTQFMDSIISMIAVRGEYLRLISQGMSDEEALKNANDFGRRVMGDRTKGSKPQGFESKNFVSRMIHIFTLEVSNSFDYAFMSDLPQEVRKVFREKGKAAGAAFLAKLIVAILAAAFAINRTAEELYGGTPAPFDFTGISMNFFASGKGLTLNEWIRTIIDDGMEKITGDRIFDTDEMKDGFDWNKAFDAVGSDVANDMPYVRNIAGVLGIGDQSMPTVGYNEMWDYLKSIGGDIVGEDKKLGGGDAEWDNAGMDLLGVLSQVIPGGRQLRKTVQGAAAMANDGRKNSAGNLMYPTNDTAGEWIQALLFGPSAIEKQREYYASGAKTLSESQTKAYYDTIAMGADRNTVYDTIQAIRNIDVVYDKEGNPINGAAIVEKAKIIGDAALMDPQKLTLFCGAVSDSKKEAMSQMLDNGMTWSDIVDVMNKYCEIDNSGKSGNNKATDFAYWLDGQGYGSTANELVQNTYTFWMSMPSEATRYEAYKAAGMSGENAYELAQRISALEPDDEHSQITYLQKYKEVAAMNVSEAEKAAAMSQIMTEGGYARYQVARRAGVSTLSYTNYLEQMDGKNSSQANVYEALAKMSITNTQRAAIWDTYGWKTGFYEYVLE